MTLCQLKVETFTETFSTQLDSKGRITVPANIRKKLGLEKGDRVKFSVRTSRIRSKKVSSIDEALNFVKSFDSVENFSFDGEEVEVELCE